MAHSFGTIEAQLRGSDVIVQVSLGRGAYQRSHDPRHFQNQRKGQLHWRAVPRPRRILQSCRKRNVPRRPGQVAPRTAQRMIVGRRRRLAVAASKKPACQRRGRQEAQTAGVERRCERKMRFILDGTKLALSSYRFSTAERARHVDGLDELPCRHVAKTVVCDIAGTHEVLKTPDTVSSSGVIGSGACS